MLSPHPARIPPPDLSPNPAANVASEKLSPRHSAHSATKFIQVSRDRPQIGSPDHDGEVTAFMESLP